MQTSNFKSGREWQLAEKKALEEIEEAFQEIMPVFENQIKKHHALGYTEHKLQQEFNGCRVDVHHTLRSARNLLTGLSYACQDYSENPSNFLRNEMTSVICGLSVSEQGLTYIEKGSKNMANFLIVQLLPRILFFRGFKTLVSELEIEIEQKPLEEMEEQIVELLEEQKRHNHKKTEQDFDLR